MTKELAAAKAEREWFERQIPPKKLRLPFPPNVASPEKRARRKRAKVEARRAAENERVIASIHARRRDRPGAPSGPDANGFFWVWPPA
jgi:hypothetical protein